MLKHELQQDFEPGETRRPAESLVWELECVDGIDYATASVFGRFRSLAAIPSFLGGIDDETT